MKISENSKYEYWKWVLLNNHSKLVSKRTNRNIVAVYNPIENTIFRFDLDKKVKIKTIWKGIEWLFKHCLSELLTIDELEDFYKSLPAKKKRIFWDCISRSCYEKNCNRAR